MTASRESKSDDMAAADRVAAQERRRRRTGRRGWMLVGACVLMLVALRIGWGVIAQRRWDNVVQRLRDAGEPLLLDELRRTTVVPDENNAALLYQDAALPVFPPSAFAKGNHLKFEMFFQEWRAIPLFLDDSWRIVEANRNVLNLLHQARNLPEIDWGYRFGSGTPQNMLRQVRQLSRFACSSAITQELLGDHAECVEILRDLHAMDVRVVDGPETAFILELVATACEGLLTSAIEVTAPTLEVDDAQVLLPQARRPASREQVKALIRDLLDDESWQRAWVWSMNANRAMIMDAINSMMPISRASATPAGLLAAVAGPSVKLDGAIALERMTQGRDAGMCADFVHADAAVKALPVPEIDRELSRISHFTFRFLTPSISVHGEFRSSLAARGRRWNGPPGRAGRT